MSGSGKVLFGGAAIGNYYSIIKSVWWRNWANHWQLFGVNTRKPDSK
jgi:hypothetical protein